LLNWVALSHAVPGCRGMASFLRRITTYICLAVKRMRRSDRGVVEDAETHMITAHVVLEAKQMSNAGGGHVKKAQSRLTAISRRMGFTVAGELFSNLFLLVLRKRLVASAVFPAIAPAISGREYRAAADPHTIVHHRGECSISGTLQHAGAQPLVSSLALFLGAAAPIRNIVIETAIAPQSPVFQCTVRKEAAPVAPEIVELCRSGTSGDQEYTCEKFYPEKPAHTFPWVQYARYRKQDGK
jgi:hypothetical protein